MKRIKKLASILLAMVMVLGMTMTTFAAQTDDPSYNLTIKTVANHTYEIWQLATGDVSSNGEKLSNVELGANVATTTKLADIENLTGKENAALGDAALALINTTGTPFRTVVGDGNNKVENLPGGYYVITDKFTNAEGVANGDSVSRTMVTLVADTMMEPKTITVEPDKKIKETVDGTEVGVETNEASIGDVVNYQLSGSIPDMTGYDTFKYVLVDTTSKGLVQNLKVGDILTGGVGTKNDDTDLVEPLDPAVSVSYKVTAVTKNGDGTNTVRIAVLNPLSHAAQAGNYFYVDIDATLTVDADVVGIPNTNKVTIDWANNPNVDYDGEGPDFGPDEPHGTTVDATVKTFTTSLTLTKVDATTKEVLTGAEFQLKSDNSANVGYVTGQKYQESESGDWYQLADGAYTKTEPTDDTKNLYASTTQKYELVDVNKTTYTGAQTSAKAFVNSEGKVVFTGLGVGDFTLTEETTPDGYNTIDPITFKVTWNETDGFKVVLTGASKGKVEISDENQLLASTIPNSKGSLLPSTGGIGTTIFYVVGAVLAIGAGILLVTKKRMSAR